VVGRRLYHATTIPMILCRCVALLADGPPRLNVRDVQTNMRVNALRELGMKMQKSTRAAHMYL
jgi:hypothetical protein